MYNSYLTILLDVCSLLKQIDPVTKLALKAALPLSSHEVSPKGPQCVYVPIALTLLGNKRWLLVMGNLAFNRRPLITVLVYFLNKSIHLPSERGPRRGQRQTKQIESFP